MDVYVELESNRPTGQRGVRGRMYKAGYMASLYHLERIQGIATLDLRYLDQSSSPPHYKTLLFPTPARSARL